MSVRREKVKEQKNTTQECNVRLLYNLSVERDENIHQLNNI